MRMKTVSMMLILVCVFSATLGTYSITPVTANYSITSVTANTGTSNLKTTQILQ